MTLYQFECLKEHSLFYYQHGGKSTTVGNVVSHCPVCSTTRIRLTGRQYHDVEETKQVIS